MISLVTPKYLERILGEFKEYSTQADISFVRKSIQAIGRITIKLESCADRCINVLLYLLQSKVGVFIDCL